MNAILGNQPVTMSSREIAELTGKRHDHVKRDIEKMLAELGEDAPKFGGIYFDSMNRQQEEYHLDRELTETLLLGYSAPLRRKVIRRLRELEAGLTGARPLTTAETLLQMLQMQVDAERRQAEQDKAILAIGERIHMIEQAHAILDKMPSDCESIVYVRQRIGKEYSLSVKVIDQVMRQSPYAPTIRALVRNPHIEADGSHYAGFAKKEVSAIFKRFADECRHSAGKLHTHPYIEGRFQLIRHE